MGHAARRLATRCDNQATYWQLVRAGCGIGFIQTTIGRADPQTQELDLNIDIPSLPVWLAAHQVMRHTPRISKVWELLASGLAQHQNSSL